MEAPYSNFQSSTHDLLTVRQRLFLLLNYLLVLKSELRFLGFFTGFSAGKNISRFFNPAENAAETGYRFGNKWHAIIKVWERRIYYTVNPREVYIFRKLHTLSAKRELTAGPAKLHSQIFYYTARGFINNKNTRIKSPFVTPYSIFYITWPRELFEKQCTLVVWTFGHLSTKKVRNWFINAVI